MFDEAKRYAEMIDMPKGLPHLQESDEYVYFEPKPRQTDRLDDSTLEGCLRHAAKVEVLMDK